MSIQPRFIAAVLVIAAALALLWISLLQGCCETSPRTASVNEPRRLFDGNTLSGWQGLVGNPYSRAEMSSEPLLAAQAEADLKMRKHWSIDDATLIFDGHGSHLCTIEDYGDFVLELEWMIEPGGDSGIYLRGSPQVQIWDIEQHPEGSGGLYNNQQGASLPLVAADHPPGQWNHFRIEMRGVLVTVDLNGQRVVEAVALENYWNRELPLPDRGPIELQSHGSRLQFRNLTIQP